MKHNFAQFKIYSMSPPTSRTINKIITGILYILRNWEKDGVTAIDNHTLFKTMFLADRDSLAKEGASIFGDTYTAMQYGPVPSHTRNIINPAEKTRPKYMGLDVKQIFNISVDDLDIPYVSAMIDPSMDFLSDSDVEYLESSIAEMKRIGAGKDGFDERVVISHGLAWTRAKEANRHIILDLDILEEGHGDRSIQDGFVERQNVRILLQTPS